MINCKLNTNISCFSNCKVLRVGKEEQGCYPNPKTAKLTPIVIMCNRKLNFSSKYRLLQLFITISMRDTGEKFRNFPLLPKINVLQM